MIKVSRRVFAVAAGVATAAGVVALALPPDARIALTRIAVVAAGIVMAIVYLRRSGSATQSTTERFELELRRPTETPPPVPGLRAVEMAVRLSTANAFDFNVRLRPMLRDMARWRLLTNRGVDLDAKPEAARRLLGERLTNLIEGPVQPPPFGSPGVPLADIDAALTQLEQI